MDGISAAGRPSLRAVALDVAAEVLLSEGAGDTNPRDPRSRAGDGGLRTGLCTCSMKAELATAMTGVNRAAGSLTRCGCDERDERRGRSRRPRQAVRGLHGRRRHLVLGRAGTAVGAPRAER